MPFEPRRALLRAAPRRCPVRGGDRAAVACSPAAARGRVRGPSEVGGQPAGTERGRGSPRAGRASPRPERLRRRWWKLPQSRPPIPRPCLRRPRRAGRCRGAQPRRRLRPASPERAEWTPGDVGGARRPRPRRSSAAARAALRARGGGAAGDAGGGRRDAARRRRREGGGAGPATARAAKAAEAREDWRRAARRIRRGVEGRRRRSRSRWQGRARSLPRAELDERLARLTCSGRSGSPRRRWRARRRGARARARGVARRPASPAAGGRAGAAAARSAHAGGRAPPLRRPDRGRGAARGNAGALPREDAQPCGRAPTSWWDGARATATRARPWSSPRAAPRRRWTCAASEAL